MGNNDNETLEYRLFKMLSDWQDYESPSINAFYLNAIATLYDMEYEIYKEYNQIIDEQTFISRQIAECEHTLYNLMEKVIPIELNDALVNWKKNNRERNQYWHVAMYLRYLRNKSTVKNIEPEPVNNLDLVLEKKEEQTPVKLKWKAKTSQFAFIMIELFGKGYIEKPAKGHRTTASILMEHFDIETTIGTLEKEINPNSNSLEMDNSVKIKIPKANSLS